MKTAAGLASAAPLALALVLAGATPTFAAVVFAYCGYIGGDLSDSADGVAVDPTGSAYVSGRTGSSELTFPLRVGPDLTRNNPVGSDGFVARVRADGSGLVYAGYIGGSQGVYENRVAVDEAGSAYLAGETASDEKTFPVIVGPDLTFNDSRNGNGDAFVAKVSPDGTLLLFAGYIGGELEDQAEGLAVDALASVIIAGDTYSSETSFPVRVGPDLFREDLKTLDELHRR